MILIVIALGTLGRCLELWNLLKASINESNLEKEYANKKKLTFKMNMLTSERSFLTKNFVITESTFDIDWIRINEVVWLYLLDTERTSSNEFSIVIQTKEKKQLKVKTQDRNMAITALQELEQNCPKAVVGYTKELEERFSK